MIKSVHKAMAILTVLADSHGELISLSRIAERCELPKPTCAHLLKTLEADGYAVKISSSKGYILGPAAYYLSRFGKYSEHLVAVARPVMRYLHHHLGHTVLLAVLEGKDKYILDYFDDGVMFSSGERIKRDDIYRTATGRIVLSHLSKEQIAAVVKKHGLPSPSLWEEAASADGLKKALAKIKEATVTKTKTVSETKIDMGYGAPIFDGGGCVAALGIAVRITAEKEKSFSEEEKKINKLLVNAAQLIGERLCACESKNRREK